MVAPPAFRNCFTFLTYYTIYVALRARPRFASHKQLSEERRSSIQKINHKFNDKRENLCYNNTIKQTTTFLRKETYIMKTLTSAIFFCECEQAVFQYEEYSFALCAHIKIGTNRLD